MRSFLPVFLLLLVASVFPQVEDGLVAPTPEPASSTLRARVYFENSGRPVRRTNVVLLSAKDNPREASGLTDAQGNLVIKNLRAGKYYAIVNAPGAVSPIAYIDYRRTRSETFDEQLAPFPPIIVNGVSDVETIIQVKMGGAISGRISYADGGPAIGVRVEILRKVADEYLPTLPNFTALSQAIVGGAGTFRTDDRGQYRFAGLPEGEYIVKVTEEMVHSNDPGRPNRMGFDDMIFGSASLVSVFFGDAFDLENAQKLKVEFGQEYSEANIVIPERPLHILEGRLISAKDKLPIRGARLTVTLVGDTPNIEESSRQGRRDHAAYTDDKGNWMFTDLPKGKYKVVAQAVDSHFDDASKTYGSDRSAANSMASAANAVNTAMNAAGTSEKPPPPKFAKKSAEFVIEEKDLTEQVIELSFGATLKGNVIIEDDDGLTESLTLMAADEGSDITSSTTIYPYDYDPETGQRKSAKLKEFAIDSISSGLTYLTIHTSAKGLYVKSAFHGQIDLLKGPINLKDGEVLSNIKIVLAKDSGELEVTVIDGDDRPVSGYDLMLVPTDPAKYKNSSFYRSARSDVNGEFKVSLPPFEYAAVVFPRTFAKESRADFHKWLAGAVKSAQTFKIEAAKTTKARIAIRKER